MTIYFGDGEYRTLDSYRQVIRIFGPGTRLYLGLSTNFTVCLSSFPMMLCRSIRHQGFVAATSAFLPVSHEIPTPFPSYWIIALTNRVMRPCYVNHCLNSNKHHAQNIQLCHGSLFSARHVYNGRSLIGSLRAARTLGHCTASVFELCGSRA